VELSYTLPPLKSVNFREEETQLDFSGLYELNFSQV